MAQLEEMMPGARVRGVLPDRAVTVVQAEWHGTQALTLTHRDDAGRVDHELLYRSNEAALEIEEKGRCLHFAQSPPERPQRSFRVSVVIAMVAWASLAVLFP